MTLVEWATTLAAFVAVLTFIAAIVAKLIKGYADNTVSELVKNYLSELKPNSGSSLRDEVKSIKTDVESVRRNVAKLEGKFEQHISESVK